MATLRVRIGSPSTATQTVRFEKLPVRIGRGSDCELRLDYTFVSRHHVRIDLLEGRLVLRDEGSRLGTRAFEDRSLLPPNVWIELASVDHQFFVGPLHVRAELIDDDRSGNTTGSSDGDADSVDSLGTASEDLESATVHHDGAEADATALDTEALLGSVHDALGRYHRAASALANALSEAGSLPARRLRAIAGAILEHEPDWEAHAPIRAFIEKSGIRPVPMRLETMALRVLRDLSDRYVPYASPLGHIEAIAAFGDRLECALSILIEGTTALRFAYLAETDGDSLDEPRSRDLAAHLLDWTGDRSALDDLGAQLAAMVGHHRRLVADALESVDRTLATLRPSAIETGVTSLWNPFRYRRLWTELGRRHAELSKHRPWIGRTLASVAEALGLLKVEAAALPLAPTLNVGWRP